MNVGDQVTIDTGRAVWEIERISADGRSASLRRLRPPSAMSQASGTTRRPRRDKWLRQYVGIDRLTLVSEGPA